MLTILWAFSQSKSFCNSNVKDHWSQITIANITMKKFEILQELLKCGIETWTEQMLLEKMAPINNAGLPQFVKKRNKVKHNKREMPVIYTYIDFSL